MDGGWHDSGIRERHEQGTTYDELRTRPAPDRIFLRAYRLCSDVAWYWDRPFQRTLIPRGRASVRACFRNYTKTREAARHIPGSTSCRVDESPAGSHLGIAW